MFEIFSMVSGIDISYKTVERLYLNELVMMALHNMQVLSLKKGIRESDATGDGIVYSMTVKNYESYAQELKDKAKENRNEGDDNKDKQSAKKRSGLFI